MGFFVEWLVIVEKYHRYVLLGILGSLFLFDIITTTVALQQGDNEGNLFMISLVQSPILHLVIKIAIYILLFFAVERAYLVLIKREKREKRSALEKMCFQGIYAMVILALIYLISFYFYVVAHNTLVLSA
jgi:small-conductance mechanosensitive channel